jgi:hypothetical protein
MRPLVQKFRRGFSVRGRLGGYTRETAPRGHVGFSLYLPPGKLGFGRRIISKKSTPGVSTVGRFIFSARQPLHLCKKQLGVEGKAI